MEDNLYTLLVSHSTVLFPLAVCLKEFKYKRDYRALYLAFHLVLTVVFSISFHSYDYGKLTTSLDPDREKYSLWRYLDFVSSRNVLYTNICYISRFRTDVFYIFSFLASYIFMMLDFDINSNLHITTVTTIMLCSLTALLKIHTYIQYLYKFWIHFIFTGVLFSASLICLFNAGKYDYNVIHTLWHLLIFTSSGYACLLKIRLDSTIVSNRSTSNSL